MKGQHKKKPHSPYSLPAVPHDPVQHESHGFHNEGHGLPKDVYGHSGQDYGTGGEGEYPTMPDNEAHCD